MYSSNCNSSVVMVIVTQENKLNSHYTDLSWFSSYWTTTKMWHEKVKLSPFSLNCVCACTLDVMVGKETISTNHIDNIMIDICSVFWLFLFISPHPNTLRLVISLLIDDRKGTEKNKRLKKVEVSHIAMILTRFVWNAIAHRLKNWKCVNKPFGVACLGVVFFVVFITT